MSEPESETSTMESPRTRPPRWVAMRAKGYGPADILRAFSVTEPPVKVATIAQGMEVELKAVTNVGFDASLDSTTEHALIKVNKSHPPVRQRFSIAHELGHLMMHRLGESFRDTAGSMGGDPREQQANQFAAELLMPAAIVKRLVPVYGTDIKGLAGLFRVSEAAMGIRLRTLYGL